MGVQGDRKETDNGTAQLIDIAEVKKAEDAAHSSGDKGIMALAVRNDTLAALAGTDGDYAPLQVDADGGLFLAPLPAGSAAIGKLAANSGVDIGDVTLTAGTALIGKVGIDQTTPGTTDQMSIATGQGAGATIGVTSGAKVITDAAGTIQQYLRGIVHLLISIISVKIDQTTPGTTNKVIADPATTTQADYNVTLTSADTQYSQALPANCRGFEFQCRTDVAIRWSKTTGKVAGPTAPYKTLKAGDYYWSPPLNQGASPDTLYFASASADVIIELTAWT